MGASWQCLVVTLTTAAACAVAIMLSTGMRMQTKARKASYPTWSNNPVVTIVPEPAVEPARELGGHEHHWKIREEISDAFNNVQKRT